MEVKVSRAASLATCGDPFTTLMWYKLFKERWYDEVDAVYININNHCGVPVEVINEMVSVLIKDPKIHLIYHPRGKGNGPPVAEIIRCCDQDLIMLCEEDGFIFDAGYVNFCFQQIESDLTDCVGSPRFSCGVEVGDAAKKRWGLNYGGYGDVGPNMWPNFFFCKRADLLRTDMDFGSHTWQPGEYSKELDHTFKEVNHGDTFVWMCVQLRALGLRFDNVPQHHAGVYEVQDKLKREQNWHPATQPFHWIHAGSLSAGWGGYLSGRIPDVSHEMAMYEMETRVAFWKICMDQTEGFKDFKSAYRGGMEELIVNANLSTDRINAKIELYEELLRV